MAKSVEINVHHITRLEGHGNIKVRTKDGVIEECQLDIVESPRFFEAMIEGRSWKEVRHITTRICGICAVGHGLTSVQATENAFGIKYSKQTDLLKRLICHGEQIQSHVLHTYFLAAPDFVNAPSVVPLVQTHPDVVMRALRLKKFGNAIADVICGRKVHPIGMGPGEFTYTPTPNELRDLRKKFDEYEPDITATVDLFASLSFPKFDRQTEYVSLKDDKEYPWLYGQVFSSDAGAVEKNDYKKIVHEKVVDHSTAKHASNKRSSYMVGALARLNNNFNLLRPEAKAAAGKLGVSAPCHNPFMITAAQVIETAHCFYDARDVVDQLLAIGPKPEDPLTITPKASRGVGVTEVPRGILFHDYTYDKDGLITEGNLVIPTNQNLANIEDDMRALVPQIIDQPKDKITLMLEMLVRAYDPCISCAVHLLNVEFI
ncbi:MAG: Ni/Fe hydrogenase subunit alpha [Phycisphaerae bacterium]